MPVASNSALARLVLASINACINHTRMSCPCCILFLFPAASDLFIARVAEQFLAAPEDGLGLVRFDGDERGWAGKAGRLTILSFSLLPAASRAQFASRFPTTTSPHFTPSLSHLQCSLTRTSIL